jgi:hypothetical protein
MSQLQDHRFAREPLDAKTKIVSFKKISQLKNFENFVDFCLFLQENEVQIN